jgi:RNA polymerase primary sigma factor
MAKHYNTESEVIKNYLDKLKDTQFLTKAQEIEIGYRIKNIEIDILKTIIKFDIFKKELKELKIPVDRNISNVVKYSKKLIDDSEDKDKQKIKKQFNKLFKQLDESDTDSNILKTINKINFSSSVLNKILSNIKKTHTLILDFEEKQNKVFRFLEVTTLDEYNHIVRACEDDVYRRQYAKHLYTDERTLVKYLNKQEDKLKFYKDNGLDSVLVTDIKHLVKELNVLEEALKADREKLIKANLPLVVARAKKFSGLGIDLEDLIQEGNIGLIKAIDKFEPSKNIKITTYATWWIDQVIRRSISNKSKLVRIPIHIQQNIKKINQAFFVLSQKLQREPTTLEIAKFTDIDIDHIKELNNSALYEIGIDEEISSGISYNDVLFKQNQDTPTSITSKNLINNRIRLAISELEPRLQKIIKLKFGIGEKREHTLDDIGVKFGLSKERIRQLKVKAINKLKEGKRIPKE